MRNMKNMSETMLRLLSFFLFEKNKILQFLNIDIFDEGKRNTTLNIGD
jgi:hypothetical protein